ncbi:MAG: type II secretion system protein GspK, partial [Bdellovibrionales bacterium]|nr:type II secretion system protein GspK [Bdellovibrionales bacterium]
MMMALFTTTLLMVIATEIMYETSVEYVVSSQSVNQVRAYWGARAGVELSLLRIHMYRQALSMGASKLPDPSILDEIWRQPFLWPPPIPADLSTVSKDEINKAVKASDLTAIKVSYFATIEAEGAKIDLNDLGSPSKVMAEAAYNQILQVFNQKVENDEEFAKRHRGDNFQELINNIADWIDSDSESRNGGDERQLYTEQPGSNFLPPNQPFRTLQELHLVAGMTDELYDVLAPAVTLYGSKGINVNQAKKEVFLAFGPSFTPERVDQIITDRSDPKRGPFKDEDDFVQYLNSIGISGNPFENASASGDATKVPLVFEPEVNFRIQSTGKSGQAQSDITAIVYDTEKVQTRLEKAVVVQATKEQGQAAGDSGDSRSDARTNSGEGKGKDSGKDEKKTEGT